MRLIAQFRQLCLQSSVVFRARRDLGGLPGAGLEASGWVGGLRLGRVLVEPQRPWDRAWQRNAIEPSRNGTPCTGVSLKGVRLYSNRIASIVISFVRT